MLIRLVPVPLNHERNLVIISLKTSHTATVTWKSPTDKVWVEPHNHHDIMIHFRQDHTTSSLQGSEITCETDHWIPMFPYPASLGIPPLSPHMACECLAAIAAASQGSGVKAKASLCSEKWARQDISTETQLNPLEEQTQIRIAFPSSLLNFECTPKSPGIFLFIFYLFTHKIWSNPSLPWADAEHLPHIHSKQSQWQSKMIIQRNR